MLEGKIAVITGATRGIGKAIVEVFLKNNASVALISRSQTVLTYAEELQNKGLNAIGYQLDVSDFQNCQIVGEKIIEHFGKVDILVNNAGITRDSLFLRMTERDWDEVINVNLKSVFNMTKALLPQMIRQRSGNIINMSSVVGLSGNAGQANYSASKAGIIGFTKSLAKELGTRNIRCNAIAPGFIETDMTKSLPESLINQWISTVPLRRIGEVEDVAKVALFLASDMSSYITGQVINVCGGVSI